MVAITAILAATLSLSAAVSAQHPVDHDKVLSIPVNVDMNTPQMRHLPSLEIRAGCAPYPAIDAEGNWSGGLDANGKTAGQCGYSEGMVGQTYSRMRPWKGMNAIVYTWFFPKTQPITKHKYLRHRYNWLYVVAWVDQPPKDQPNAPTGLYGLWTMFNGFSTDFNSAEGHPAVAKEYYQIYSPETTTNDGNPHSPMFQLVDWDKMPYVQKAALVDGRHFGDQLCPLGIAEFNRIIEAAQPSWMEHVPLEPWLPGHGQGDDL